MQRKWFPFWKAGSLFHSPGRTSHLGKIRTWVLLWLDLSFRISPGLTAEYHPLASADNNPWGGGGDNANIPPPSLPFPPA